MQRILAFGGNPAHTQVTQDVDSNLHTSSAAHTCQQPSPVETLPSSINNMTELTADPQGIMSQTQPSKTSPFSKHRSDSASCHKEGTGSKPQAAQAADAKIQLEHSTFPHITSSAMCEPVQPWPQPSREDGVDSQLLASKAGMQLQWLMMGSASDATDQKSICSTLLKAIAKVLALSFTGTQSVFLLTYFKCWCLENHVCC